MGVRGATDLPKGHVSSTSCRVPKLWSPHNLYLPCLLQPLQLTRVKAYSPRQVLSPDTCTAPFHTCLSHSCTFLYYFGRKKK